MWRTTLPGRAYPQGATWDGAGTNFAIYSENAEAVELCLFEDKESGDHQSVWLREVDGHVWHCYLPWIKVGQLYGYRVHGPFDPERGLRFNPAKLVIDPYAKALVGKVNWKAPVFGYTLGEAAADLTKNEEDSAWGIPKAVVTTPLYDWENDRPPLTPLHESILYETHVKGFTALNENIPPELRGTYTGLAYPSSIDYLKRLGITAVELMPVHDFLDDNFLLERGLRNYWGYNTTNFFSPDARYSGAGGEGEQVSEFKTMVKALHRAGIEVILDVVFNHTSEGNHLGPTLSFRGVDNSTYYRLVPGQPRYYMDYTGCGNTLNARHPQVLKLLMDSLRYWALEMHVDGFRFDLAAALARELHDVDRLSAFFDVINQDPVISQLKLIAEPWDVGEGGYQVGNFPPLWAEWNGKYRDTVRRYWRGDPGQLAELGYRLTGSSDLYQRNGRSPSASINFITAHDGFTLHDLVSYNDKHNEANGEENRDGTAENYSYNYGAEGPTDDPEILEVRDRQKRNFLATLFLSQGVPMMLAGDEIGHSQQGNNNAYCQDNELTWLSWDLDEKRSALLEFARRLIELRKAHPNLHRRKYFQDRQITPGGRDDDSGEYVEKDIVWLRSDGGEMKEQEWNSGWVRSLGLKLSGQTLGDVDSTGGPLTDDTFLILLNSHDEPVDFRLPLLSAECKWELVFDTRSPGESGPEAHEPEECYHLTGRSVVLLRGKEGC